MDNITETEEMKIQRLNQKSNSTKAHDVDDCPYEITKYISKTIRYNCKCPECGRENYKIIEEF